MVQSIESVISSAKLNICLVMWGLLLITVRFIINLYYTAFIIARR